MTSPTMLTSAPMVPTGTGPASPSAAGSAVPSPGFASALDDALTGGADPGKPQTDKADDAPAADEPGPDGAPPTPPVVLQPGLWALLGAVLPLSAPVPSPTAGTGAAVAAAAAVGLVGEVLAAAGGSTPTAGAAPVATPFPIAASGAVTTAAVPAAPAPPAPAPSAPAPPAPAPPAPATAAAAPPASDPADLPSPVVMPTPAAAVVTPAPAAPATPPPASAPATDAGTAAPAVTDVVAVTASGSASDAAGSNSDGAGDGPATVAVVGSDDTLVAPPTIPTVTTAAPAADAPATPVTDDAPVAAQLSRHLAVLSHAPDGSQTMTLVITPEDLGPVSIRATVTGGNLELTLHGAHEHGRHALVEALPDLRRDLESAGISLDRLEVGADAGGDSSPWARAQQQLADSQGQGRPAAGPRGWARTGAHPGEASTARPSHLSTSSGVDLLV